MRRLNGMRVSFHLTLNENSTRTESPSVMSTVLSGSVLTFISITLSPLYATSKCTCVKR
jgi:hypothetical protein